MIKLNDTYTADGNTWVVTSIDEIEGVYIEWDKYIINVCACDEKIYTYKRLKNGGMKYVDWGLTFGEIEMVNAIVSEVKTWEKVTMQRII